MNYQLLQGECIAEMSRLPTASIDAILADPPYMTTNLHFDKAPALDWAAWWEQAWRVVKPSGVVVLFAADLFTVDLILTQRANYRYRLVWEKTRFTRFLDANRRPLQGHEDILVFCRKPAASTYNPQRLYRPDMQRRAPRKRPANAAAMYSESGGNSYEDTGQRHPHTVLKFASGNLANTIHPTQKPLDLMQWLVRTYTNPGETVLDCFAGSGSTLHACLLEDRHSIGIEQDAGYYTKAQARLQAVASAPSLFAA